MRNGKFWLVGSLGGLAVMVVAGAALAVGTGDLDTKPLLERVLHAAQARKDQLLLLVAIVVVAAGIWLAVRRQRRAVVVLALTSLLAASALGWYEFRHRFPNQGIFSAARLDDSMAILLGTDIRLSEFQPKSLLVIERKRVDRAAYPAIDVHFHLESLSPSVTPERLVQAMNAAGIAKVVNLGGLPGDFERYEETLGNPEWSRYIKAQFLRKP